MIVPKIRPHHLYLLQVPLIHRRSFMIYQDVQCNSNIRSSGFPSDTVLPPKTSNDWHVKTQGEPVRSKVRRLSPKMLEIAKKEIDRLLEEKIIRRETSPWGSPIHLVKKKQSGQYRLTVDFCALNAVTEHDSYLLPYLNDFTNSLHHLHGCKIFSIIDLKNAFHRVPMHLNSVAKTCTVTPFGSFIWDYFPFVLRNSAQCFQRHINRITSELDFGSCIWTTC